MNNKIIILVLLTTITWSCQSIKKTTNTVEPAWFNMAIANDVEIYVDTASIRHDGAVAYATEKRIYLTNESKKEYVNKIREEYSKLGKPEKADKWNDFSYCIYHCLYECTNKRFRILSVEDFDSKDKRIAKTSPAKENIRWLNIESETVGDYTFFYICDFE